MVAVPTPTGLSAFLFTDVEGSTRLWEDHTDTMRVALEHHDAIMRAAIEGHDGYVFSTAGDAFAAAFHSPSAAVRAAIEMQQGLAAHPWEEAVEIRVRIGIHVGEANERDGDYFGPTLNRGARLMSAAHGGQLVISQITKEMCEDEAWATQLVDLGRHQFKDLSAPEQVWQITVPGGATDFAPLRTIDRRVTNLPVQLTEFIGRHAEREEVAAHVANARLVTLRGLGGMGKTRLSLQVAADLFSDFPDGVWFVQLAPVREPDAVPFALTEALGIPAIGRPALDAAVDSVGQSSTLIVLDNCEHVLDAATDLVGELLRQCPNVRVIATSRMSLNLAGEILYNLLPLEGGSQRSPAVELFVQRARAANPGLDFDDQRYATISDLCDHLDRVPLAIELAAARTRSMTPEDISDRLDQRFRLLRAKAGVDDRHQRLIDTVEWSFSHLDVDEQLLFCQLSVFAGTFSLEAVQAVCADDDVDEFDIIDQLEGLVDQSMMIADLSGSTTRYALLETMRMFGHEKLGDHNDLAARHAQYFADTVRAHAVACFTTEEAKARNNIDLIWDDLRAAWTYARDARDVDLACALTGHLTYEVMWRSRMEASIWAQSVLDFAEVESAAPIDRIGLLTTAAAGLMHSDKAETARAHVAQARAMLPELDVAELDHRVLAVTSILFFTGNLPEGVELCSELMQRIDAPADSHRLTALLAVSKASMLGYLGKPVEAVASAALGQTFAGLAPTWDTLASWDLLRWSSPSTQGLLKGLVEIQDAFSAVNNRFLLETAQRHLLSVKASTAELSDHLAQTADALSEVDLSDPRYATGWMLTGAIGLLKAGHFEPAATLLAWQERHRVAPIQPGLQADLDELVPEMLRVLGADAIHDADEALGDLDFAATVSLAIAAMTEASEALAHARPKLSVVANIA